MQEERKVARLKSELQEAVEQKVRLSAQESDLSAENQHLQSELSLLSHRHSSAQQEVHHYSLSLLRAHRGYCQR